MRILLAGSEFSPFARTGGLGDVLDALPRALTARGHETSVAIPCYRGLRTDPALGAKPTGVELTIQVGGKRIPAEILEASTAKGVQVFLIRHDAFFDRAGLYGDDQGDYQDNAERFIFFSKAVMELARRVVPPPEILHVHDWQAALIPVLRKERRLPFRTVLTIHNLAYQGSFWGQDFHLTNLPGEYFTTKGVEFYGRVNLLKGGIVCADQITTVSEHYAREIRTPEYGAGLDAVVRENGQKITGILNGVDYETWNPGTDPRLPERYTKDDLQGKRACRNALLAKTGLDADPSGPVFAMVTRLAEQKGIDLLLPLVDRLLASDARLIILGAGEARYARELGIASRRHAGRFACHIEMEDSLAHLVYAGSDVFLVPSRFEPCGLSAMYALKYGSLPVARSTGGLHQILQDYDPDAGVGNAILFHDASPEALWDAMVRAIRYFSDAAHWRELVGRAMACNYSWERAAIAYEEVYRRALRGMPA